MVEGWTRAEQTDRSGGYGLHDPGVAMPILLHGDAAFAGQGVVAETLNYYALEGYWTGGTLHVITNNQVGFTTDPEQGRSTRYSSDLAKGFDVPIVHVNADDPEAAISAVRLALAYRRRFGHDVVIDLVGYRRFGHNEQDEAGLYAAADGRADRSAIRPCASCTRRSSSRRACSARRRPSSLAAEALEKLREAHERLKASFGQDVPAKSRDEGVPRESAAPIDTRVPADLLRELNEAAAARARRVHGPPEARAPARAPPRRARRGRDRLGPGRVARVRVAARRRHPDPPHRSGHRARHVLAPPPRPARRRNGERATPIQELAEANASFEVYNSPLSEFACVGFEYGYSAAAPEALVLWEAQFGDFANGAQTIIDQFISSGLAKWRQTSRLTLLLPHGVRGQRARSTRARGSSASSSSPRRRTSASRTARPPRSTSTSCGGRRSTRARGRSS